MSTLTDIQNYQREAEAERGFADQDIIQTCLTLGEEVGELFKAVRLHQGMRVDVNCKEFSVENELADVLTMLCAVANRLNINLEEAFHAKEAFNKTRKWKLGK